MKRFFTTRNIAYSALGTAIVFVVTLTLRVDIGATGYVNLGDAAIIVLATLLGPIHGMIIAGLGSALADLVGYPYWAPFTLIIKAIMGLVVGLASRKFYKEVQVKKINYVFTFLGYIFAEAIMVLGYFLAKYVMYATGFRVSDDGRVPIVIASAAVASNCVQAGIALAVGLFFLLTPSTIKRLNKNINKKEDIEKEEDI